MATVWYFLLAVMLAIYAVVDGWDLGVGAIHRLVAKTDEERRISIGAIGPLWNGNEVWLISAGGALFLSFPRVYAASFSGFYLALMLVLWLLIIRGISIEFRSAVNDALWASFWDTGFAVGSLLLSLLLGVALGNLIGGLPIGVDGLFQGTFGILLNGLSVVVGLLSVALLALHGANYLCVKTDGPIHDRSRRLSRNLSFVVVILTILSTLYCMTAHPGLLANYSRWPILYIFPLLTVASLVGLLIFTARDRDTPAFVSGIGLIVSLLMSAATSLYPSLLFSTVSPALSLTVDNAASADTSLRSGLIVIGLALFFVAIYQTFIYRTFLGKVKKEHLHGAY